MLCRSEDRAAEAVDWIQEDSKDSEGGGGSVRFEKCNLGSVESVKKCAEKLNQSLDTNELLRHERKHTGEKSSLC